MRVRAGLSATVATAVVLGLTAAAAPALASGGVSAPAAVAADSRSEPDGVALRAAIDGLPDGDATAALVRVRGKKTSWHGSSGVRDLVSGREANPEGRFRAGSTTKVVTAAVVLQLAAEGRVDLGAPVQRYLPELFGANADAFRKPISVRQLLNHSSGLQPGRSLGKTFEELYANRFVTLTPQEVAVSSIAKGPAHDPGVKQEYLGINYTLLGLLIERLAFRPLKGRADAHFAGLISSIALAGMVIALLQWRYGPNTRRFPAGSFPDTRFDVAGSSLPADVKAMPASTVPSSQAAGTGTVAISSTAPPLRR